MFQIHVETCRSQVQIPPGAYLQKNLLGQIYRHDVTINMGYAYELIIIGPSTESNLQYYELEATKLPNLPYRLGYQDSLYVVFFCLGIKSPSKNNGKIVQINQPDFHSQNRPQFIHPRSQ